MDHHFPTSIFMLPDLQEFQSQPPILAKLLYTVGCFFSQNLMEEHSVPLHIVNFL